MISKTWVSDHHQVVTENNSKLASYYKVPGDVSSGNLRMWLQAVG